MKRFLYRISLTAVLVLVPLWLNGAEAAPPPVDMQAALEFLRAKGTPRLLERNCRIMLEQQFKSAPELKKFEKEMSVFFNSVFSFEALGQDMARIYLKRFSAAELRALTAFYRSPAGQKLAETESEIAPEIAALLTRRATEAMPALHQALETAAKKK